ncbi:MAG: hypothetical protein IKR13_01065, partial [Victivallales bacterium]|nr:hypothetical protein [Victivallales bacterium]
TEEQVYPQSFLQSAGELQSEFLLPGFAPGRRAASCFAKVRYHLQKSALDQVDQPFASSSPKWKISELKNE